MIKKLLLSSIIVFFVCQGCASADVKERLRVLERGTVEEKVAYLRDNYASPQEIVEFLGEPSRTKYFYGGGSAWYYDETEYPLEVLFGATGRLLEIRVVYNTRQ